MSTNEQKPDPGTEGHNILHEADIGSGERSPGQQETDEMIKSIPPRGNLEEADQGGSEQNGQPSKA